MQQANATQPGNLKIRWVYETVVGRQKNSFGTIDQDYVLCDNNNFFYIIADGIGGKPMGDEASRIATQSVEKMLRRTYFRILNNLDVSIENEIKRSFEYANYIISALRKTEQLLNFGTTLDAACIYKRTLYIGHVGDSRVYLFRNGALEQITKDHKEQGVKRSPLLRYIGLEGVEIDTHTIELRPDDTVLMATDGLSDVVSSSEIAQTLSKYNLEDAVEKLVEQANFPSAMAEQYAQIKGMSKQEAADAIGGKDDISVILLKFSGG